MKRYVLLVGDAYYPSAWDDYAGQYDTLEDAIIVGNNRVQANDYSRWFSVFDLEIEEEVANG